MSEFIHLHLHTDFSLLDGACKISDVASRAAELGMPAAACTDHGNMSGAVNFYREMSKTGVKPIIGCEFYVAPGDRRSREREGPHTQGYHLVLLAEDSDGYRNLCQLNSIAALEGFYYKPRVDKEVLAEHSQGLIALSACLAGEIPAGIVEDNEKKAIQSLNDYLDIFGRNNFYLEIQDHGIPEQTKANRRILQLAKEYEVPVVATNDVHYLEKSHAAAHDVLLCIGTQSALDEPNRLRYKGEEFYFKDAEEMARLFQERPDALTNTMAIGERCNVPLKLDEEAENHYPVFVPPGDKSRRDYLRELCLEAIPDHYNFDPHLSGDVLNQHQKDLLSRLDFELEVINQTGFTSYFLVVWDFIRFARDSGIPVGPGRGSGAGSLVAYLTKITDIDPIQYGLLFERFLNPDRVSPPDFDIDLCERRRQEVITYVREKYGTGNVAQIGTYGTLKPKAVIKDVARTMGRAFAEVNTLTKLIPNDPKITLESALASSNELRELEQKEEWVREVLKYSKVLEGLNRNPSIHAAGVIIGDQKISNLVPLSKGTGNEIVTQYPAGPCEALGLLKMDFLGLRTLTIIQDSVEQIKSTVGKTVEPESLPMADPTTFELLNKGNTVGVFQLESSGMRDLCRRFGVSRIEDIIALIALYRPGPMEFLDEFIQRKTGRQSIDYDVPAMEPILSETYGIMLYQEQVMQVVQKVAGFSLGQADILRRAMGKKKIKVMEEQHGRFIQGCINNNIDEQTAQSIWEKIAKFAGYGFNKSHSAAYAFLSYRTAYYKANYPLEFMAAVLNSEIGNHDKLTFFLRECAEMRIEIAPPNVNTSGLNFTVADNRIWFGLGAIKGVGSAAARQIITSREKHGTFTGLQDFCEGVENQINKRVMENLCRAGAFDCFGQRRSQIFAMLDEALGRAQQNLHDKASGQGSLFDLLPDAQKEDSLQLRPPDIPEWEPHELLSQEKELLGFYVTGHPLARYQEIIDTFQIHSPLEIQQWIEHSNDNGDNKTSNIVTRVGGIITAIDNKRSKKNQRQWAILRLEGMQGYLECLAYPDTFEKYQEMLVIEAPVFIEGNYKPPADEGKNGGITVTRIIPLAEAPEMLTAELHLHVYEASTDEEKLKKLRQTCHEHPGKTPLVLGIICDTGEIAFVRSEQLKVRNSEEFRQLATDILGKNCLVQKPDLKPLSDERQNRNGNNLNGYRKTA